MCRVKQRLYTWRSEVIDSRYRRFATKWQLIPDECCSPDSPKMNTHSRIQCVTFNVYAIMKFPLSWATCRKSRNCKPNAPAQEAQNPFFLTFTLEKRLFEEQVTSNSQRAQKIWPRAHDAHTKREGRCALSTSKEQNCLGFVWFWSRCKQASCHFPTNLINTNNSTVQYKRPDFTLLLVMFWQTHSERPPGAGMKSERIIELWHANYKLPALFHVNTCWHHGRRFKLHTEHAYTVHPIRSIFAEHKEMRLLRAKEILAWQIIRGGSGFIVVGYIETLDIPMHQDHVLHLMKPLVGYSAVFVQCLPTPSQHPPPPLRFAHDLHLLPPTTVDKNV